MCADACFSFGKTHTHFGRVQRHFALISGELVAGGERDVSDDDEDVDEAASEWHRLPSITFQTFEDLTGTAQQHASTMMMLPLTRRWDGMRSVESSSFPLTGDWIFSLTIYPLA